MIIKPTSITSEMCKNYFTNALIRKEYDSIKNEFRTKLDKDGNPEVVPITIDLQPRKTYNQNCIVRKISRNEYAYA